MGSTWQMVREQDVQVIVVLTCLDSDEYPPFWPLSSNTQMMWSVGHMQYNVAFVGQEQNVTKLRLEVMKRVIMSIHGTKKFSGSWCNERVDFSTD